MFYEENSKGNWSFWERSLEEMVEFSSYVVMEQNKALAGELKNLNRWREIREKWRVENTIETRSPASLSASKKEDE